MHFQTRSHTKLHKTSLPPSLQGVDALKGRWKMDNDVNTGGLQINGPTQLQTSSKHKAKTSLQSVVQLEMQDASTLRIMALRSAVWCCTSAAGEFKEDCSISAVVLMHKSLNHSEYGQQVYDVNKVARNRMWAQNKSNHSSSTKLQH
eukprot:2142414-Amphidinium_carterae.1